MRITSGASDDGRINVVGVGATVAVFLSDSIANASWRLHVSVRVNEGRHRLGTIITAPPNATCHSRLVALAVCPGAKEWFVEAELVVGAGLADEATAELALASQQCCVGLPNPLTPNVPFATLQGAPPP